MALDEALQELDLGEEIVMGEPMRVFRNGFHSMNDYYADAWRKHGQLTCFVGVQPWRADSRRSQSAADQENEQPAKQ